MTVDAGLGPRRSAAVARGMTRHGLGVGLLMALVLAHWGEHVVQAIQIWVLGWPLADARGVLGQPFPALVREEWLHYGYNASMLVGLLVLLRGFAGEARRWWMATIVIQLWHHFEHLILLIQAQTGNPWFGEEVPHSVAQLVVPRVELHLFYNGLATMPMLVAVAIYMREHRRLAPRPSEGG